MQAAARAVGRFDPARRARFSLDGSGQLVTSPAAGAADLLWEPGIGWQAQQAHGSARALLELYLPISSASAARPITVAHLGQSLDGFIATRSGDSSFVTGPENILHLHRLRALCDAVLVGAGTVNADNPRLTTRLVPGHNPTRVILDPTCRLPAALSVFSDQQAPTLRVCGAGRAPALSSQHERDEVLEVPSDGAAGLDLRALMAALHARGLHRVFIEGGGVTVSSFLQAGLVDRLHIAIAPLLIGDGKPAVRLPARLSLQECLRLRHSVYRTGEDILFDCDLRAAPDAAPEPAQASAAS